MKLSEVIEALELQNEDSEGFLDLETMEFVWFDDMLMSSEEREQASEQLDEHGFARLPSQREIDEYSMMEDFTYSCPSPVKEKLARAISGRGAFRRFKDTVNDIGIDDRWYAWRDKAYWEKAKEWCEEYEIEFEDDTKFTSEQEPDSLGTKQPKTMHLDVAEIMSDLDVDVASLETLVLNCKNQKINRYFQEAAQHMSRANAILSDALFEITTTPDLM